MEHDLGTIPVQIGVNVVQQGEVLAALIIYNEKLISFYRLLLK